MLATVTFYHRYAVDPKDIWSWYKDYMFDEEVRTENETSLHRSRGEYTVD